MPDKGAVEISDGGDGVFYVEFGRPPTNYFDVALIESIVAAYHDLDRDTRCRAIVLCSSGRHFCAGADLAGRPGHDGQASMLPDLYRAALGLFESKTPVVAAVQGAAIGGGLGLALSADFRVAGSGARFAANFAQLGIHHGFGLTVTLPAIVGQQRANDLLFTGRRVTASEALTMGLCDRVSDDDDPRVAAREVAAAVAAAAPLAVRSIRTTMRGDLAESIRSATQHEWEQQRSLIATADFREGVAATAQRRTPTFIGG